MGQWLSERLGQPFMIENRPGAGSNIATEAVVSAPADGYTLLLVCHRTPSMRRSTTSSTFNFIRDIAPVGGICRVRQRHGGESIGSGQDVPEFIAYAKANPGKINMASPGIGSPHHVAGELFKMMAGVEWSMCPIAASRPRLTDLLGGQVQVLFGTTPASLEHIRTGKLRRWR